jgi:hypothetical protein
VIFHFENIHFHFENHLQKLHQLKPDFGAKTDNKGVMISGIYLALSKIDLPG